MKAAALCGWMGEVTAAVREKKIDGQQQDIAKTANAEITVRDLFFTYRS